MPAGQQRVHYPALDGLRGVAILLVVFYHNFGFFEYSFFGWLGVDLFFVLSGFLITGILLNTVNAPHYFKNFYIRRILRIFPLYYLSLLLFLIILPAIKNFPLDFSYYTNNQWWFWAYLQNWFLIFFDAGNTTTAIQHYWSLAVEEQFYIIWPMIIFMLKKPGKLLWFSIFLLIAVIATRFILWEMEFQEFNYFGLYTFTRIDGICIGSILATLVYMRSYFLKKYFTVVVLALAGINFLFFFINRNNQFTLPYLAIAGYTTFAAIFALIIHEITEGKNMFINLVLNFPVLKFFGRISYGFYIFHWPVYLILYKYVDKWFQSNFQFSENLSAILISVILTITGIIISTISFYSFEKYFLGLKKKFTR